MQQQARPEIQLMQNEIIRLRAIQQQFLLPVPGQQIFKTQEFVNNKKTQHAIMYHVKVIGELCVSLKPNIQQNDQPMYSIKTARNKLTHRYKIDYDPNVLIKVLRDLDDLQAFADNLANPQKQLPQQVKNNLGDIYEGGVNQLGIGNHFHYNKLDAELNYQTEYLIRLLDLINTIYIILENKTIQEMLQDGQSKAAIQNCVETLASLLGGHE